MKTVERKFAKLIHFNVIINIYKSTDSQAYSIHNLASERTRGFENQRSTKMGNSFSLLFRRLFPLRRFYFMNRKRASNEGKILFQTKRVESIILTKSQFHGLSTTF